MAGICSFICCVLLFVSSVRGIDYSHTKLLDGTAYKVHWMFDNETETFYFKVEVNTTGWVGFGVSQLLFPGIEGLEWNRKSMDHYDVIIGGVDENGTKYYKDYMTDGHVHPTPDTKQESDWIVTNLTEVDGRTVIEFTRKQNTSDTDDHVIGPGRRWIVWSYHTSSDVTTKPGWQKHTANGHYEIDFIELPGEPPVLEYVRTEAPTSGAFAASIIGNFLLIIVGLIFFY